MSAQNTISQPVVSGLAFRGRPTSEIKADQTAPTGSEAFTYDAVKVSDAFRRQTSGASRLELALDLKPFETVAFTESPAFSAETERVWGTAPTMPTIKNPLEPSNERAALEQGRLAQIARRRSANRRPDGRCYNHVWRFLQAVGSYGRLLRAGIPNQYSTYARQFAQYADKNLEKLGLRKLPIDNPYLAPAGSLVVVRPGAPGTRHPVAGDIAVADGKGRFFNGGEMRYGGPKNFPPGNKYVLGIYVPA